MFGILDSIIGPLRSIFERVKLFVLMNNKRIYYYYKLRAQVSIEGGWLYGCYFERGEVEGLTPRSELASLFAENEVFMAEQRVRKHYPEAELEKLPIGSVLVFPED